jgi:hypothetical protein
MKSIKISISVNDFNYFYCFIQPLNLFVCNPCDDGPSEKIMQWFNETITLIETVDVFLLVSVDFIKI